MSILTRSLPNSVMLDGKTYRVHTCFRNWLALEEISLKEATAAQKLSEMLKSCYIDLPQSLDAAVSGMVEFYRPEKNEGGTGAAGAKKQRILSFYHDAQYIYAAFYRRYHIDLTEKNLHWWQFLALLTGLDPSDKICKIMEYRAMDLSDIKDNQLRRHVRHMKRLYKLPDNRTPDEAEADIMRGLGELF